MKTATAPRDRGRLDFKPVDLSIVASGTARLISSELAAVRKESLPNLPVRLSPLLLRHSDEQTLAALVALSEATKSIALASKNFADWAVVSSSRSLGRSAFAAVIDKYRSEGPWGVSVQVIPHCTAHAVAGTISLALQSHGPCIGGGGGANSETDAMLAAASLLRRSNWCGAWIVFTAWSPERTIDTTGRPASDSICLAAAIAVTRQPSACSLGRIRMKSLGLSGRQMPAVAERESRSSSLTEFFAGASGSHNTWSSSPTSGMQIDIELARGNRLEPAQRPAVAGASRIVKSRVVRAERPTLVA